MGSSGGAKPKRQHVVQDLYRGVVACGGTCVLLQQSYRVGADAHGCTYLRPHRSCCCHGRFGSEEEAHGQACAQHVRQDCVLGECCSCRKLRTACICASAMRRVCIAANGRDLGLWTFVSLRVLSALLPKADIGTQSWNVRFVPKADIGWSIRSPRRLWQGRPGGIAKPSLFAVLRLITNSNLVGCRTGNSAGFAPFRILPAKIPI